MDRKVMVYKEFQSLWIKENYNNIHETSLSADYATTHLFHLPKHLPTPSVYTMYIFSVH